VPGVVGELGAERVECGRDQARDPIGVAAGATSAYERGQPGDALGGVRLSDAAGDLLHGGGD